MTPRSKSIVRVSILVTIIAYLIASAIWSYANVMSSTCKGVHIFIEESTSFVTEKSVINDMQGLYASSVGARLRDIDLPRISKVLNSNDRIEKATVTIGPGSFVNINIVPMQPVARVFDGSSTYYINIEGKHITADCHYRIDVPIIQGHFSDDQPATDILPLLQYINNNDRWRDFVTMIKFDSPTNILLVPAIKGQIINIGDISNLDRKFDHIETFYKKVLPVKGWNYYDTISVKWNKQVVATRRNKIRPVNATIIDIESEKEIVDGEPTAVDPV